MMGKRLGMLKYDEALLKQLLFLPNSVNIVRTFMDDRTAGQICIVIEQANDDSNINLPQVPDGYVIPVVSQRISVDFS